MPRQRVQHCLCSIASVVYSEKKTLDTSGKKKSLLANGAYFTNTHCRHPTANDDYFTNTLPASKTMLIHKHSLPQHEHLRKLPLPSLQKRSQEEDSQSCCSFAFRSLISFCFLCFVLAFRFVFPLVFSFSCLSRSLRSFRVSFGSFPAFLPPLQKELTYLYERHAFSNSLKPKLASILGDEIIPIRMPCPSIVFPPPPSCFFLCCYFFFFAFALSRPLFPLCTAQ
jgi:hypothetical protein